MTWSIIHTIASILMLGSAVFILSNWRERYTAVQRLGLGLAGGCGFLRINVIWERTASPFYEWAPTLMTFGVALFIFGSAMRDWKHTWGNWRMNMQAREHLKARGKL